jgi:hypothetical protein
VIVWSVQLVCATCRAPIPVRNLVCRPELKPLIYHAERSRAYYYMLILVLTFYNLPMLRRLAAGDNIGANGPIHG